MHRRALALILCVAGAPALACEYPPTAPAIPDGRTATSEQMVDAQKAVKEYVSKMEAYIACLDTEATSTGDEPPTEAQQHIHVQKHNAAVDEMQNVADKYNAEVRAFKSAQDEAKY
jgi:hypothetical protein